MLKSAPLVIIRSQVFNEQVGKYYEGVVVVFLCGIIATCNQTLGVHVKMSMRSRI